MFFRRLKELSKNLEKIEKGKHENIPRIFLSVHHCTVNQLFKPSDFGSRGPGPLNSKPRRPWTNVDDDIITRRIWAVPPLCHGSNSLETPHPGATARRRLNEKCQEVLLDATHLGAPLPWMSSH